MVIYCKANQIELHEESKNIIHSVKFQRSKELKLRYRERKFFEPYLHIYKRCKSTSTEWSIGAM